MDVQHSSIAGCLILRAPVRRDERGYFVKVFHEPTFRELGLETDYREDYYSDSARNVIRGLHFQVPPMEHTKLVSCIRGKIVDVVVDLRRGAQTYGHFEMFELVDGDGKVLYLEPGLAHGFCSLADHSVLAYKVSSAYSPDHDAGVRWDSVGIPWPTNSPILSERDRAFPAFAEFKSPF